MKLKADFTSDWLSILRDTLQNHWGYDISGITDDELPLLYLNAEKRRPDQRPRTVILSDTFSCPDSLQAGWNRLKGMIETGQDITANLSKLITQLINKDSMLNDWGVHHFHLGSDLKGEFVERTGPLLFALIRNEIFYAIGVYEHGSWADPDIIEVIHRNWPEAVSQFRIHGASLTTNFTEQDRITLRQKNVNGFTTTNDGTIYAPIGGGTVCAGHNINAVLGTIKQRSFLKSLESQLQARLKDLTKEFTKHGYSGEPEIEARLEITENEYIAIFPKFKMTLTLKSRS
jgi:hypothetical protein